MDRNRAVAVGLVGGLLLSLFLVLLSLLPDFLMRPSSGLFDPIATPTIVGGVLSKEDDWPATFAFGDGCTSTAIGPKVILTAAHCVKDGGSGMIEFGEKLVKVKCEWHPAYVDGVSQKDPKEWEEKTSPDFALCEIKGSVKLDVCEKVNAAPGVPQIDNTLRLTGFGCVKVDGKYVFFDDLYEGDAKVKEPPKSWSYFTRTLGGAAVCFGDSGSGAFLYNSTGQRVLVAVNATIGDTANESLLSTTGTKGFVTWAEYWSDKRKLKICWNS